MKSLRWWFTPKLFVKPVADCPLFDHYLTLQMLPLTSLLDDRRRYGWRVMLFNIRALFRMWRGVQRQ